MILFFNLLRRILFRIFRLQFMFYFCFVFKCWIQLKTRQVHFDFTVFFLLSLYPSLPTSLPLFLSPFVFSFFLPSTLLLSYVKMRHRFLRGWRREKAGDFKGSEFLIKIKQIKSLIDSFCWFLWCKIYPPRPILYYQSDVTEHGVGNKC